jgi:methylated-DNA-[protein]-cysteine S-methyltransferase
MSRLNTPRVVPTVLLPAAPAGTRVVTARVRLDSPVGGLEIEATDEAIVAVHWVDDVTGSPDAASPLLSEARAQLVAYFARRLAAFDLPLAPAGSPFERDVWRQMCDIPLGETMTYGDMAAAVGGMARAVGSACGANPIPIIIPCHRVLGAGNRMVGYSGRGRIETKRWLLVHEGALLV